MDEKDLKMIQHLDKYADNILNNIGKPLVTDFGPSLEEIDDNIELYGELGYAAITDYEKKFKEAKTREEVMSIRKAMDEDERFDTITGIEDMATFKNNIAGNTGVIDRITKAEKEKEDAIRKAREESDSDGGGTWVPQISQLGASAAVGAINAVDQLAMGDKNFGAQSAAIDSAVHGISGPLIASGNPYAMAAGVGLEAANFMTKAGGLTVEGFDVDIKGTGYGSNLKHRESSSSRDFGAMLGFGGLNGDAMDRKLIARNQEAQLALKAASIAEDQSFEYQARQNTTNDILKANQVALDGGIDTSVLAAKQGAKINKKLKKSNAAGSYVRDEKGNRIWVPYTINDSQKYGEKPFTYKGKKYFLAGDNKTCISEEAINKSNVKKALNGAKLEQIEVSDEANVLPTGSLHKNKHDDFDLDVTKKGIPVITVKDDTAETLEEIQEQKDSVVLHAEVEKEEVILSKELTDYIEDARKKWHESDKKDDSICLEVGLRLCKELLFNTKDEANFIEKVSE